MTTHSILADRPSHANMEDSPQQRTFRPDIEGMRAVAVLLVILYHAGVGKLTGGYVGVDVFFVISGFLITSLLLRQVAQTGTVSLRDFYARRARRILPAAGVVLVGTALGSYFFLDFLSAKQYGQDGRWAAVFLANFRFSSSATNYLNATAPPSAFQHYWSLAIEEQFYVVWPPVIIVCAFVALRASIKSRLLIGISIGVLTLASLAWCVIDTRHSATEAYFSPFTRGWELGLGAFVAVVAPALIKFPRKLGSAVSVLGLAAVLASAFLFDASTAFPGYAATLPVFGTALLIAGGTISSTSLAERFLALPPMQWFGKLSYSLYLVHWPVLIITAQSVGHDLSVWTNLGLLVVSVGLAAGLHYLVENPIRRARWLVRSINRSVAMGIAVVAVALIGINVALSLVYLHQSRVAYAAAVSRGSEGTAGPVAARNAGQVIAAVSKTRSIKGLPPSAEVALSTAAGDRSPAYTNGCLVTALQTTSPDTCVYGDTSSSEKVVLVGDSHAAQWLPALQAAANRDRFELTLLAKSNCPFVDSPSYNSVLGRVFSECPTWRSWALAKIAKMRPSLVVLATTAKNVSLMSGSDRIYNNNQAFIPTWDEGLSRIVQRLQAASGRVAMLSDVPKQRSTAAQCLAANISSVSACAVPRSEGVLTDQQESQGRVVRSLGVSYVDVLPWLCTDDACPSVINGMVVDWDDSHLTATYSTYLSAVLAQALGLK